MSETPSSDCAKTPPDESERSSEIDSVAAPKAKEYGGRKDGLDPTRFGDWEKNGRCIDF